MLFTPVAPRIKSKGLPIGGPLLSKTVCFFTRIAPHTKKQGAPDRWPLIQQKKLMLFTCVAPRTKTQEAPDRRSTSSITFSTFRHILKARGSIGMSSRFIILLIKFPKVFAAQLVSSSLCIIQIISH
jgi:hypothetical protein